MLKKTVEKLEARFASEIVKKLREKPVIIKEVTLLAGQIEAGSADILKSIAYQIRNSSDNTILVAGAEIDGKAHIVAMVCDSLVKEKMLNAVLVIREIAGEIDGGGGGQPFLATAGGKKPSGIPEALKKAEEYLKKIIG